MNRNQNKGEHSPKHGKGMNNTLTCTGDTKTRCLNSRRRRMKNGFLHPIMGFLSAGKLRCLELTGCDLKKALLGGAA